MSATEPFVLINAFEVEEDFQAAVTSNALRPAASGLTRFPSHPGLYRVVGR